MKKDNIISELSDKECLVSLLSILNTPVLKRKLSDDVNELVTRLYDKVVGRRGINTEYLKDFFGVDEMAGMHKADAEIYIGFGDDPNGIFEKV